MASKNAICQGDPDFKKENTEKGEFQPPERWVVLGVESVRTNADFHMSVKLCPVMGYE